MKPSDIPKKTAPPTGARTLPMDKLDRKPGNIMYGEMIEHHMSSPGQGTPEVNPKHGGRY